MANHLYCISCGAIEIGAVSTLEAAEQVATARTYQYGKPALVHYDGQLMLTVEPHWKYGHLVIREDAPAINPEPKNDDRCIRCWGKLKLDVRCRPVSINTWTENGTLVTSKRYACTCGCTWGRTDTENIHQLSVDKGLDHDMVFCRDCRKLVDPEYHDHCDLPRNDE